MAICTCPNRTPRNVRLLDCDQCPCCGDSEPGPPGPEGPTGPPGPVGPPGPQGPGFFHTESFGYNAPADSLLRYPRIIIGTGSDTGASPGVTVDSVIINAAVATVLTYIHIGFTLTPGSTTFQLWLYAYGTGLWSVLSSVTQTPNPAGATIIDWTVSPHVIPAGGIIALSVDPTTNPGMVLGQMFFDPA